MTERDQSIDPQTTWPIIEAILLAGLADDPDRLAHAVERVEDLLSAGSELLLQHVNSWLSRFRYEFRIERAPDGRLYATGGRPAGRQVRWPILAEVLDCTPRPATGRVSVLLRERGGTALVVETDANDAPPPGSWVGVTGTLMRRVIEPSVVMDAPAPEPYRSRAVSKSATNFAEGYLAGDPPSTLGLVAWVERALSRADGSELALLLALGWGELSPSRTKPT